MNEQLKQAIEGYFPILSSYNKVQKELQYSNRLAVKFALVSPSILRYADPEIMKQAGWVQLVKPSDEMPKPNYKRFVIENNGKRSVSTYRKGNPQSERYWKETVKYWIND